MDVTEIPTGTDEGLDTRGFVATAQLQSIVHYTRADDSRQEVLA
jgi:hypothetical protein